ncbi:hypothetical protein AB0P05_43805 [Streptomyces flaveolus]|uniref:hypothetical protein n=1 Tax=Streptomyces flaveolus TaxID=67297 RepID=UPI0034475564
MIDSSKTNRWQLQNQVLSQCLNPASTGANANARVVACSATNDWNTHSFDVRRPPRTTARPHNPGPQAGPAPALEGTALGMRR